MRSATVLLVTAVSVACWLVSCSTPAPRESQTAPSDWEVLKPEALASSHKRISFAEHIKPVLTAKCVICHNRKTLPSFSMENRELAFASGGTGPRIAPGHPELSLLIFKGTKDHAGTMPAVGERLTENEKRILTAWVQQGADWPTGKAGELRNPN